MLLIYQYSCFYFVKCDFMWNTLRCIYAVYFIPISSVLYMMIWFCQCFTRFVVDTDGLKICETCLRWLCCWQSDDITYNSHVKLYLYGTFHMTEWTNHIFYNCVMCITIPSQHEPSKHYKLIQTRTRVPHRHFQTTENIQK